MFVCASERKKPNKATAKSEHAATQSGRAIATRGLKNPPSRTGRRVRLRYGKRLRRAGADRAADLFCIELEIGSSCPSYPNTRSSVKIFHSFSDFLWL